MKKLAVLTVASAAIAFGLASPRSAHACSCVAPTLPDQIANSDVVFVGTVLEEVRGVATDLASDVKFTFAVERTFKGAQLSALEETVDIWTNNNSAACGSNFEKGTSYVVYAMNVNDSLRTGLCSGNTAATPEYLADVERESGASAEPQDPQTPQTPQTPPAGTPPPVAKGNPSCGGCAAVDGSRGFGDGLGGFVMLLGLACLLGRSTRRNTP